MRSLTSLVLGAGMVLTQECAARGSGDGGHVLPSARVGQSGPVSLGSLIEGGVEEGGGGGAEGLRLGALTVYWENDGALVKRFDSADRHYTNGMKIEASFQPGLIPGVGTWLDSWLDLGWGGDGSGTLRHAGGLAITQLMFTPEDIRDPDVIEDDRPYAGYLYFSLFHQRRSERVFDHLGIDVGVVGEWSGAEGVQKAAHAAFPNEFRPEGWSNQLVNELGANMTYQRRWRSRQIPVIWGLETDAIAQAGFQLGNVWINASAGATVRLGWRIPDDFGTLRISEFRDATAVADPEERWSVYGFGRVTGKVVGRDMFLDGNTLAESHSVDSKPFVGDFSLGIAARYRAFELSYSITWLTEEFEGQEGADSFGMWAVGWNFEW